MRQTRAMLAIAFLFAAGSARAADRLFAYDLTTATTFTGVYLAPAGTEKWGANQALNDRDKSLEPNERLALKGIERGLFDVKLVDKSGRICLKRGVDLTKSTSFDIREADLAACSQRNAQGSKKP